MVHHHIEGCMLVGSKPNISWTRHSPHITALDLFLWGYVKDKRVLIKDKGDRWP